MTVRSKPNFLVGVTFIVWATVLASGLAVLLDYGATAGALLPAPAVWPSQSSVQREAGRPSLVLFLHPKCPCSRATLAELREIVARIRERATVTVLVLQPESAPDGWADSRIARSAAAIPGVAVKPDIAGTEVSLFHATTSGETFLYDARGRLQFHGGITGARGHIGDNAGRDAVQSLVLCGASPITATSAFGCPLYSPSAATQP